MRLEPDDEALLAELLHVSAPPPAPQSSVRSCASHATSTAPCWPAWWSGVNATETPVGLGGALCRITNPRLRCNVLRPPLLVRNLGKFWIGRAVTENALW